MNGESCGRAFTDLYGGRYYPAVSLFHQATIHLNFGPFDHPIPEGARPMSDRVDEQAIEETVSDIVFLTDYNLLQDMKQEVP